MEQLDPNTPAGLPPPGVVPNFNAPSRAGAVVATCVTITVFMVIFVALRLFSRTRYAKRLGADDCKSPLEQTTCKGANPGQTRVLLRQ